MTIERREIPNPTPITINWPASKETVARFTSQALTYETARDMEFRSRSRQIQVSALGLEGLLYDIGHYGRGMQDFPRTIDLAIPQPTKGQNRSGFPNLISTMPFSVLYGQINTNIERYIIEVYRKQEDRFAPGPDAKQGELELLKAFMEQTQDKLVTVTFQSFLDDLEYMIRRMATEGYTYDNPY